MLLSFVTFLPLIGAAVLGLLLRGDDEAVDRLNERIMVAIQRDGRVYCSNAVIDGRFGLRACIVNFRTEAEHVERLLAVARELGKAERTRIG